MYSEFSLHTKEFVLNIFLYLHTFMYNAHECSTNKVVLLRRRVQYSYATTIVRVLLVIVLIVLVLLRTVVRAV